MDANIPEGMLLRVCAVCGKDLGLKDGEGQTGISHTYCDFPCLEFEINKTQGDPRMIIQLNNVEYLFDSVAEWKECTANCSDKTEDGRCQLTTIKCEFKRCPGNVKELEHTPYDIVAAEQGR